MVKARVATRVLFPTIAVVTVLATSPRPAAPASISVWPATVAQVDDHEAMDGMGGEDHEDHDMAGAEAEAPAGRPVAVGVATALLFALGMAGLLYLAGKVPEESALPRDESASSPEKDE